MHIPTFDPSNWRFGFEVEMLFGTLGLQRYEKRDWAFDRASKRYCCDIAERLSALTGEKWRGYDEAPSKTGFHIVPEYDLDPFSFPSSAIGGVELITPPMPLQEAEELRTAIVEATMFEGGFVLPPDYHNCGWHLNVDSGSDNDRGFSVQNALPAMWEGEAEVETLMWSGRYETRYAKPQYHAYGPRLLNLLRHPNFPLQVNDLGQFLHYHCGQTKHYATNLAKLRDCGYVELRHYGLDEFMQIEVGMRIDELFGSILRSLNIGRSNSRPFQKRLMERFDILAKWLDGLKDDLTMQTRDMTVLIGREGRLSYKGELLASVHWTGVGELSLAHQEVRENWGNQRLSIIGGLDSDEILPGIAILALDALYAKRVDTLMPVCNSAFVERLDELSESFENAGLFPSAELLKMGG